MSTITIFILFAVLILAIIHLLSKTAELNHQLLDLDDRLRCLENQQ